MADSHYEVEVLIDGKFSLLEFESGWAAKYKSRSEADSEAINQSNNGVPAKVVLVKTIRSVIVAYKPKAAKP